MLWLGYESLSRVVCFPPVTFSLESLQQYFIHLSRLWLYLLLFAIDACTCISITLYLSYFTIIWILILAFFSLFCFWRWSVCHSYAVQSCCVSIKLSLLRITRYIQFSQRFFSCFLDLYSVDFVSDLSDMCNTLNVRQYDV